MSRLPLPSPKGTFYARIGIGPEASAGEIRAATAAYIAKLRAGGADDEAVSEANSLNLANAEKRAEYAAAHPPLALLRLVAPQASLFTDRATSLAVVRRDIEDHLRRRGVPVGSPSDLTRRDFTADFSHNPILDGSAGDDI